MPVEKPEAHPVGSLVLINIVHQFRRDQANIPAGEINIPVIDHNVHIPPQDIVDFKKRMKMVVFAADDPGAKAVLQDKIPNRVVLLKGVHSGDLLFFRFHCIFTTSFSWICRSPFLRIGGKNYMIIPQ